MNVNNSGVPEARIVNYRGDISSLPQAVAPTNQQVLLHAYNTLTNHVNQIITQSENYKALLKSTKNLLKSNLAKSIDSNLKTACLEELKGCKKNLTPSKNPFSRHSNLSVEAQVVRDSLEQAILTPSVAGLRNNLDQNLEKMVALNTQFLFKITDLEGKIASFRKLVLAHDQMVAPKDLSSLLERAGEPQQLAGVGQALTIRRVDDVN